MPDAGAARLSTHVLDTAAGRPAAGVRVELFLVAGEERQRLVEARTNADGRTDAPLLTGKAFGPGVYELCFHIGDYFAGVARAEPSLFDVVPVRFRIAEDEREPHLHVPLLVAPGGYTTYRGS